MGSCLYVSISCDQVVNQVSSCLCAKAAYVHELEDNLEALRTSVQELSEKRDDLLTRVRREENRGLQRLAVVQGWLSRVEAIESQVNDLLNVDNVEIQRLCLCGYASKSCLSSYQYGKIVIKKKKAVESLESESRAFDVVAQDVPTPMADERPIEPTVGIETMLEEAWHRLMEDRVGVLGLYGMGGVGKTTLLTKINNRFCDQMDEFDVVIWVVVSQDLQVERIQEDIKKKLHISEKDWKQKRQDEKASVIFKALGRKKFVLLLDDMWKKVNLTEIGVPIPNQENGCKVAFTTRSREVCGRMGVDDGLEVRCLAPAVAWDLFRKKVGEYALNSHPDIPKLAKIVAQKCRGLPLALNIIGETMASKRTVEEWHYSIDVLTSSAADFPGMEDEILPILKFSYDNLKGEKAKLCFLYCALFPEDYDIEKRKLVDYWVGEGIVDGNRERGRVANEGFEIIGILLRACLLEEDTKEVTVKMHDVVREMALWIASDFGKQKENFVVQTGVGLRQIPKVKNWKDVSRMSLMNNEIGNIYSGPNCPKLLTLFLNASSLVEISREFFRLMPNLVVLDLSLNSKLAELPEEISMLVSLQYLNLSQTGLKQLPIGLKELKNLVYLDLENTLNLQSVAGISDLLNLLVLRLSGSGVPFGFNLVKELQHLEHLNCLTTSDVVENGLIELMSSHKLRRCIEGGLIIKKIQPRNEISLMADLESLRSLEILDCHMSEIKIDWESKRTNSCFRMLYHVSIKYCTGLTDLTWLQFAPNVGVLVLEGLLELKEIVSRKKAVTVINEQPFGKLESLVLRNLRKLESIYCGWESKRSKSCFRMLHRVSIENCTGLTDLTWLQFAPNVGFLVLEGLLELKEIISKKKAVGVINEQPFGKLESLELCNLRKLESIYWDPLPFHSLRKIRIERCPVLRKLPFNSKSAEGHQLIIDMDTTKEQIEQFEWEDEGTKERFFPEAIRNFSPASYPSFKL